MCGSAHARHTLIGLAFMTLTSCMKTLLGSVGFWSVVASRASWSRFVLLSGVGVSVVRVCFIDRVVRPWVGGCFPIGVVGMEVVVFQSGFGGGCPFVQILCYDFVKYFLPHVVGYLVELLISLPRWALGRCC